MGLNLSVTMVTVFALFLHKFSSLLLKCINKLFQVLFIIKVLWLEYLVLTSKFEKNTF